MDTLALFFAAPFVIASIAIGAWFLCALSMNDDTDPYDNPDNWGA